MADGQALFAFVRLSRFPIGGPVRLGGRLFRSAKGGRRCWLLPFGPTKILRQCGVLAEGSAGSGSRRRRAPPAVDRRDAARVVLAAQRPARPEPDHPDATGRGVDAALRGRPFAAATASGASRFDAASSSVAPAVHDGRTQSSRSSQSAVRCCRAKEENLGGTETRRPMRRTPPRCGGLARDEPPGTQAPRSRPLVFLPVRLVRVVGRLCRPACDASTA